MADSGTKAKENVDISSLSIDPKNTSNEGLIEAFNNLSKDQLVRGAAPEDVEKRCLELCQTYLGGSWINAKGVEDVVLSRITGGLTNQLYRVQLKDSVPRSENLIYTDEPTEVAIKLYMPKHLKTFHEDDAERLNDIVVLTILSELGIGPKVYGIFNDGMVQAYHDHDQFTKFYQSDGPLVRELAHTLARVHHLNVPIRKNNTWALNAIRKNLTEVFDTMDAQALIDELNLENLKALDPRLELQNIEKYLDALNSPLVFCHTDFRGGNILVTKPDKKILLVDLEYSAYGYRGYDIANFMNEWGWETFDFTNHKLPSDEDLAYFVRFYIEGVDRVVPGYSSDSRNSVETIVKEAKTVSLVFHMYFISLMLSAKENIIESIPFDRKQNMRFCDGYYKTYLDTRSRLIADGTILNYQA